MGNAKSAIGYAVYSPERDTFLGRNGVWFTDVRLATIYAEPRAAKMAGARTEVAWRKFVVEISLNALLHSIEQARAEASKPAGLEPDGKPIPARPATANSPKPGTKAA